MHYETILKLQTFRIKNWLDLFSRMTKMENILAFILVNLPKIRKVRESFSH